MNKAPIQSPKKEEDKMKKKQYQKLLPGEIFNVFPDVTGANFIDKKGKKESTYYP
jgi:hypothetical protein